MASPKENPLKVPTLDRYRVPILDKTLDLLELLVGHPDGLNVTELTGLLGMPKNSVFRIATTLALRGYLEREEATKIYRVSRKLLSLGHTALGGRRLVQIAGPVLTALRDETGETALLGTLSGSRGVVLDQVASSFPVKVVVEIGHAFPLHTAAPAKAMLAYLEAEPQTALVAGIEFTVHTPHTIRDAAPYRRELERIRAEGVAYDRGEESVTYACVAAPVLDHRGRPVAAIWISGPSDRVTSDRLGALGAVVKRHALEVSAKLGFGG